MDTRTDTLASAGQLARETEVRFPHESADYRAARTALLAEEIELRRHMERVAAMRRALPPGGAVSGDYRFEGEDGREVGLADLFGDKQTLAGHSFMYGPQRKQPCPMCTAFLGPLDANAADLGQHMSLVVFARAPMETLKAFKASRGWKHLRLYRDLNDNYSRDYNALAPDGSDLPVFNVFTRRDGTIRHFWGGEMTPVSADPGQDPRGPPDPFPLWQILDLTPAGRPDWYPSLSY
jgi:predicted dithiol-disulfide oxidoreductase (DUF899 family)